MSSDEQKQILKMVESGRISAEEAMQLIKALEGSDTQLEIIEAPEASARAGKTAGPESSAARQAGFEQVAIRARRLWQIPLWTGIAVSVLSAYWLYNLVQASNFGFWFYCASVPFLLGVLIMAVAAGSRTSRWLYVKVDQASHEWPRNIVLGFPLPLGLAAWLLRNFGHTIEGLGRTQVDEILQLISSGVSSKEPLIVQVDEGEGGERVQVYIG
jgi:hypothetical protein